MISVIFGDCSSQGTSNNNYAVQVQVIRPQYWLKYVIVFIQ